MKAKFHLPNLFTLVGIYAGILLISLICTYAQAVLLQKIGQKILSKLRMDIFAHIESLSHEQLNNIPVGKLVTRVTNDTNAISMLFTNVLVTMAKNCMVLCGVLISMLAVYYALTLVLLCFVLLWSAAAAAKRKIKKLNPAQFVFLFKKCRSVFLNGKYLFRELSNLPLTL